MNLFFLVICLNSLVLLDIMGRVIFSFVAFSFLAFSLFSFACAASEFCCVGNVQIVGV